jgi:hypothetical protein
MTPAFSGPRQAAVFALGLMALLTAPVLVSNAGVLDRSDVYPTIPVYAGPYAHIQHQVFEEKAPLDVAFVGSSFMWSAIDAPYFQAELTRSIGRSANVTVLASVWPGLDRDYAILRDLLSQRQVGLVVLQFPPRLLPTEDPAIEVNTVSDQPHLQAFRLYRFDEFGEIGSGLPLHQRASLYAGAVLGLPRHLLTLARPNFTTPSAVSATLGARFEDRGYYGAPFSRFSPNPPVVPAREQVLSEQTRSGFAFHDESVPAYQMHFIKLIANLLAEYDVPAVVLHIPTASELGADVVQERMNWIEVTGMDASLVGIAPGRLFGDLSREETLRLFASDHLNTNGASYFTQTVTPSLIAEFARR